MIEPYHPSFLERLVSFFVRDPQINIAFQDEFEDHRTTGYEFDVSLVGIKFQEVSVKHSGRDPIFLLIEDAYRKYEISKYGISINSIRRLCRDGIIDGEKRSGRWFVSEYSLIDYLDKVGDRW